LTHYGRKTGKPHEVTIWFVLANEKFYINTANVNPLWIIGGVLLIGRKAFGYVVSIGLLSQASMLFIALAVFLPLQSFLMGGPVRLADAVMILVMGSVCFVPLFLFVRKAGSRQRSPL